MRIRTGANVNVVVFRESTEEELQINAIRELTEEEQQINAINLPRLFNQAKLRREQQHDSKCREIVKQLKKGL